MKKLINMAQKALAWPYTPRRVKKCSIQYLADLKVWECRSDSDEPEPKDYYMVSPLRQIKAALKAPDFWGYTGIPGLILGTFIFLPIACYYFGWLGL